MSIRGSLKRTSAIITLAGMMLVGGFTWGFFSHRQQFFPFHELRWLSWKLGLWTDFSGQDRANRPSGRRVERLAPGADPALLRSIPYVIGTSDPNATVSGVLLDDESRAWDGVNLYNSDGGSSARLVDMRGRVLNEWTYPTKHWHVSYLMPDGSLLAIMQSDCLVKLDPMSHVIWKFTDYVHHALSVAPDGRIFVLVRKLRLVPELHPSLPIIDSDIVVLDADGTEIGRFSILDSLRRSRWAALLPSVYNLPTRDAKGRPRGELDLLHVNQVQVLDGTLENASPAFRRGNLLVSIRNINAIAVLDRDTHDVVWLWGPSNLTHQHDPTLLPDGRILLFDNGTSESRVIETDPLSHRITWQYAPGKGFFSETRGSAERLPNGDTLVTDSNRGYVFEITPAGRKVWEFANPEFDTQEPDVRLAIYRMTRYARNSVPFLDHH